MKEILEFLLRTKSLTATTLARLLEIQPSGISHILSGRNKPSFDLVVKILRAFPDINPDWLLLGDERVYRDEVSAASIAPTTQPSSLQSPSATLFDDSERSDSVPLNEGAKNVQSNFFPKATVDGKTVERIVILYSDKSFDSYSR